jgi:hypothetical protein
MRHFSNSPIETVALTYGIAQAPSRIVIPNKPEHRDTLTARGLKLETHDTHPADVLLRLSDDDTSQTSARASVD